MQRLPEAKEKERESERRGGGRGGTGETRIENEPRDTMVQRRRLGEQKMDRVKTERNGMERNETRGNTRLRVHGGYTPDSRK